MTEIDTVQLNLGCILRGPDSPCNLEYLKQRWWESSISPPSLLVARTPPYRHLASVAFPPQTPLVDSLNWRLSILNLTLIDISML